MTNPSAPNEAMTPSEFAWLIEAPGAQYLSVMRLRNYDGFRWTQDHTKAIRFYSEEQADAVMMALREIKPDLFSFTVNLGMARPVEHGWIGGSSDPQ